MRKWIAVSSLLGILAALFAFSNLIHDTVPTAAADEAKSPGLVAVEEDMHEFMEYVFEPTYKRLKEKMAVQEKDRAVWKQIKSDSLILAEAGNLTMLRGGKGEQDWNSYCEQIRTLGGELYKAAKKRDAEGAQKHYVAMIEQCNACHNTHAGGEHQLTP